MRPIILLAMAGLAMPVLVHATEDVFQYNDNGKRDPFSPLLSPTGVVISYDQDMSVGELLLEGVMLDPKGQNMAIINGRIVKSGDVIGPYVVQGIGTDRVELLKGAEVSTLKINKGGS